MRDIFSVLNTRLKIAYFGLSDIGLVREHNEDVWCAIPEKGLFLVADGMGGHQAGEVAAKKAIDELSEIIQASFKGSPEEHLRNGIKKTNAAIYNQAKEDNALSGMGTTLCCLFLYEGQAIVGHVGDSRIYRFKKKHLEQITEDHSLINELLTIKAMTQEEASHFPYKHILSKALGTNPAVDPTVNTFPLETGELFLLCTDGLTNFVSAQEIEEVLLEASSLEKKGVKLVSLAKKQGGGDNITILLVNIY